MKALNFIKTYHKEYLDKSKINQLESKINKI